MLRTDSEARNRRAEKRRPPVQFRDRAIEHQLVKRRTQAENLGQVAQRDLVRYYLLLTLSLGTVRLTEEEATVLVAACRDRLQELHFKYIADDIGRAVSRGEVKQPWLPHGHTLVQKLQDLDLSQLMALVDAVERFWNGRSDRSTPVGETLRQVGILREPTDASVPLLNVSGPVQPSNRSL